MENLVSGRFRCNEITAHKGDVNWCAFSPVADKLVTASGDKTVRVWDVRSSGAPSELDVLQGHKYYVNCAVFSPIGDLLATGSSDFTVKLWSTTSYANIATLQMQGAVKCCSFRMDGALLAIASADNSVSIWEVSSLHLLRKLCKHEQSVQTCCFAPCGWMLASGDSAGEIIIWDAHSGSHLYFKMTHDMGVNCLLFYTARSYGNDSYTMISAGTDGIINIWNITAYPRAQNGAWRISMTKERNLSVHTSSICHCSLSQDERLMASASNDKTVIIWNMEEYCVLRVITAHQRFITCCCFSSDSKLLATTSTDSTAKIWHLTEEVVQSNEPAYPSAPPVQTQAVPLPWESAVLDWLQGLVKRSNSCHSNPQDEYDRTLAAKISSLCQELELNKPSTDPTEFYCPITQLKMIDPVVAADGHTYERTAIVSWLSEGKRCSPLTNLPLPHTNLVPNRTLKMYMDNKN